MLKKLERKRTSGNEKNYVSQFLYLELILGRPNDGENAYGSSLEKCTLEEEEKLTLLHCYTVTEMSQNVIRY